MNTYIIRQEEIGLICDSPCNNMRYSSHSATWDPSCISHVSKTPIPICRTNCVRHHRPCVALMVAEVSNPINDTINTLHGGLHAKAQLSMGNPQRQLVIVGTYWCLRSGGMVFHYNDVIMSVMVSQFTGLTIVYLSIYSEADLRKHQSSASQAFVRGIHWWSVNSPHKGPVTRKIFPSDDVITQYIYFL